VVVVVPRERWRSSMVVEMKPKSKRLVSRVEDEPPAGRMTVPSVSTRGGGGGGAPSWAHEIFRSSFLAEEEEDP
jgi:hypothetical protein